MEQAENLTTIYVVRHGETEMNVGEIIQGQIDSNLTEQGQQQARDLGAHLANVHFDAAFSSDLLRAKHTAEIIAMNRQLVVNTSKLIRERSFGQWEGKPGSQWREDSKAILEKLEIMSEQERRDVKYDEKYESENELAARCLLFLREIAVTYAGKTVLVVSHGGAMRAMLLHLGFANFAELTGKTIDNTAFIKLESDGVDFFIKETKGIKKNVVSPKN